MARFNANDPYRGRRISRMPRFPGAARLGDGSIFEGRVPDPLDVLMQHTDAALNAGDEDNEREFSRGGVVLRNKQKEFNGVSRTRPNVDTADGWLRGQSGEMHPQFDARGNGRLPRVTATRPIGGKD